MLSFLCSGCHHLLKHHDKNFATGTVALLFVSRLYTTIFFAIESDTATITTSILSEFKIVCILFATSAKLYQMLCSPPPSSSNIIKDNTIPGLCLYLWKAYHLVYEVVHVD